MTILSATSVAASALYRHTDALSRSAHNVANVNTDRFEPLPVSAAEDATEPVPSPSAPLPAALRAEPGEGEHRALSGTDVAKERVNQVLAQAAFTANLRVMQTGDEMTESLLDLTA